MMILTEEQFYLLWEKFSTSEIADELPDDLEEFCKENKITITYFIHEWL